MPVRRRCKAADLERGTYLKLGSDLVVVLGCEGGRVAYELAVWPVDGPVQWIDRAELLRRARVVDAEYAP